MTACEDFYEKFEKEGNFCDKSQITAREIERYLEYRKKHKLESYEINRSALAPLMAIEENKIVHKLALKHLRNKCKQIGGRSITRRISIEIINNANGLVDESFRLKEIKGIRKSIGTFEHDIDSISHDVRGEFDYFKAVTNSKNNNEAMTKLLEFCRGKVIEIKRAGEKVSESSDIEVVSRT